MNSQGFTPFDPYSPFSQAANADERDAAWRTQGSWDSGRVGETRRDTVHMRKEEPKQDLPPELIERIASMVADRVTDRVLKKLCGSELVDVESGIIKINQQKLRQWLAGNTTATWTCNSDNSVTITWK